jgi:hypothetical protein
VARNRVRVTKAELEANSGANWNAFIHFLITANYDDLPPFQRNACLVFSYDAEVQNGGHFQFFSNHTNEQTGDTIVALKAMGAPSHARVLELALAKWRSAARIPPADTLEYLAIALESEFEDLDRAFHDCQETLIAVLQHHFSAHESDYIIRE